MQRERGQFESASRSSISYAEDRRGICAGIREQEVQAATATREQKLADAVRKHKLGASR